MEINKALLVSLFLIALLFPAQDQIMAQLTPPKVCESRSGLFRGPCIGTRTNCAQLCLAENFNGGSCVATVCMCQKPCY
uniref:Defensin 3 n=1 Tax=Allium cepa TaxID=4679 RepID=A0A7D5NGP8_ALLCE|nr:defensin 3 [Allium cepa]